MNVQLNVTENSRIIRLVLSGTGVRGATGGAELTVQDSVANAAALPTVADHENEFWVAEDTGVLWYSNGTAWVEVSISGGVISFEGRIGVVEAAAGDYTASEVTNVPNGTITEGTVQGALNELDTKKSDLGHSHAGTYEPVDATILRQADVDDAPVNGVTTAPISSNWAYDHANATAAHTAANISVDASGFNGNLTTADDTVQKVAQKVDDLVAGGGAGGVSTDAGNLLITGTDDLPYVSATEITPAAIGAATAAQGSAADSAVQPGDLGDSAALDVGTTTGTVAAGDDSRFHDAVTVADSTTVDLTLTGQQVSAAAIVQMSITSDASGLKLSGDAATPGATKLYGTNADGTKGWYAQPAGAEWDGDIADINLDGGTDIGADLADADLILVDDGAGGTNRKAAMSRVRTYIRTGVVREFYVDAAAMVPRVTNGAYAKTEEYATNDVVMDYYLFDSVTEEGVQFKLAMPDAWDLGTIKAKFFWDAATGASASDGVTWGISARAVSNDDAVDAAFGASVDTDDVVIAVGDVHVSPASAAVTVSGTPALGDLILFEITRVVGDAQDDMAEDAKLFGVQIQYTELTTAPSAW